ncbi:MAG: glutathione S-transferase N-terminal domain-containing protein [Labilithrix sp.]|nr:glutathione S-transferase N-terminal domain-containing protein [Labilithrix sp.]MCW5811504.1 glutathione S-transferase N-terminal domain-containing protein [Labilithrix sp.]
MKLYYSPQVCSLVVHAVLRELGLRFELEKVDFKTKITAHGEALATISPKDYVPVLELDDGARLTELSVIVRYLADQHPVAKLAPPPGTFERVRFEELLHFIATELHKGFAPYTMIPGMSPESLAWTKERLASRVELLRVELGDRAFIFGDTFTVADAYAFWALRAYSFLTKTKLEGTLEDYLARMTAWPSIQAAVDHEKRH